MLMTRLATSVCQASHNPAGPGPCTGSNRFALSSGCVWGEYYWVADSEG